MKRIAVIGAILQNPSNTQTAFNQVISAFSGIVQGRMGIPFPQQDMAVISITVTGTLDQINALTGKLGKLPGVTVKTAVSPHGFDSQPPASPSL